MVRALLLALLALATSAGATLANGSEALDRDGDSAHMGTGGAPVPVGAGGDYLALGDSVAFGFRPLGDHGSAAGAIGYPELLAQQLGVTVTNASCPGEASAGFLSLAGSDYGCRPYRSSYPLHVAYDGAQIDFAIQFLRAHPDTRLVTLDLGANDLFALEEACQGLATCGLRRLLAVPDNLETIYRRLRAEAGYQGPIVTLAYYAPDYRARATANGVRTLNDLIVAAASADPNGWVADGYAAFRVASAASGGDPCAAGLLERLPADPARCDIHPSAAGQAVLAAAFLAALAP
jgi:lysophospholipase L1-like esterase